MSTSDSFFLENKYFKALGQSWDMSFNFLIYKTSKIRSLNNSQLCNEVYLCELAPDEFWEGIAINYDVEKQVHKFCGKELIRFSQEIDYVESKIKSSGFWIDKDRLVYNTGKKKIYEIIENKDGFSDVKEYDFNDFETDFLYTASDKKYIEPLKTLDTSKIASVDDGLKLEQLFLAQRFETDIEAKYLMGWCLLSPFGTILKRRPHIWIHGSAGQGKSWIIDNLIKPLGMDFCESTNSTSTVASLRRSLGTSGGFCVIDEMDDTNNTTGDNIKQILNLVKNATSDSSGKTQLMVGDKVTYFYVLQMFCIVSIAVNMNGSSYESRVEKLELKSNIDFKLKTKQSDIMLENGYTKNPERFFHRTFFLLHRILKSYKIICDKMFEITGDKRNSENASICLASYWHGIHNILIDDINADKLVKEYIDHSGNKEKKEKDYEVFFRTLFNHVVDLGMGSKMTIGAMMFNYETYKIPLNNIGIKIIGKLENDNHNITASGKLYIISKSHEITDILKKRDSYLKNSYTSVFKEHPAMLNVNFPISINNQKLKGAVFDLKKIADIHFENNKKFEIEEQSTIEHDDIPF